MKPVSNEPPAPIHIESLGRAASAIGVSQKMFEDACIELNLAPEIFINRVPHYEEAVKVRVIIWLEKTGKVRGSHATAVDMAVYPSEPDPSEAN